jgi:hypothetical protein
MVIAVLEDSSTLKKWKRLITHLKMRVLEHHER